MNIATYQTTPEKHGNGTFFFTNCGHNMYSIRDNMSYHGCLCPGCLWKGIQTTLHKGNEKIAEVEMSYIQFADEFKEKFNEQRDKTVMEAKSEIESFCQNKINSIARQLL